MNKQVYNGVEVFQSILTAVVLWLLATLLLGVTIGLVWATARGILRLLGG
ncbi:MAG TPA: hypothetical protein PKI52_15630 [Aggregatilineales bacterium]|nr:hypothetical protein [Aggregatilineales bacterium]